MTDAQRLAEIEALLEQAHHEGAIDPYDRLGQRQFRAWAALHAADDMRYLLDRVRAGDATVAMTQDAVRAAVDGENAARDRVRALERERDRLRELLRRGRFYSDGHSNQADGCQRCALARDVDAALREEA